MDQPAISVQGVSQQFSLHHEKSLKGLFVNSLLRRGKSRESFLALDDIDLEVGEGATMGLIGHNGSGKSTLLKIIGGVMTPTKGRVVRRGRLAALLELKAGFHGDLTGRENVQLNARLLGLSAAQTRARFDDIVDFSGVEGFIDTPMKFYSSGMFVRLGFALAIHTDPDVLLVDEVLAVGDEQFQERCLSVMRTFQEEGRTIVLVSHNMADIANFCDTVTLLHQGEVRAQGEPQEAIARYRELLIAQDVARLDDAPHTVSLDRIDDGDVRVTQVRAWAESGTPLDRFHAGDTLHVQATFTPVSPTPRWIGRVLLLDERHRILHGTTTQRLQLAPGPLTEPATIRFTMPRLPLAGGQYRIRVEAAQDHAAQPWDTVADIAEIRVGRDERRVGPLLVETVGEQVEPIDAGGAAQA